MSRAPTEKTLADYLVIAICPLLIMALVGATSFFLLDLGYQGVWLGRMRWTLFWFVLAAVLISRISIQQGSVNANIYGFLLALVTGVQIYRLMGVTLLGWGLLAFIWWCTSKLTWDCTLVDDDEDASGEGLLQVSGLERSASDPAPMPIVNETIKKKSWWPAMFKKEGGRRGKAHAPGSWVIYFSLLALPAFGLGQAFFSAEDVARRDFGFRLLGVYVAAALGLLLATSFLGLRRYLRQRSLPMPASMAGLWIFLGTFLAGAIMLGCLFLPRPDGVATFSNLINYAAQEVAVQASKYSVLSGQAADGEGRPMGEGDGWASEVLDGALGSNGKKGTRPNAGNQPGGKSNGQSQPGQQGKSGTGGQSSSQKQQNSGSPSLSPQSTDWVATLIKWLIYAVILAGLIYLLRRYRATVMRVLREMWAALREIFWNVFGWLRKKPVDIGQNVTAGVPPRKFAAIGNPFSSGVASRMSPEELVAYSFDALEVWAAERGLARLPDMTPLEFARSLNGLTPEVAAESHTLAGLYTRIAYAELRPSHEQVSRLAQLWDALESVQWNVENSAPSQAAPV